MRASDPGGVSGTGQRFKPRRGIVNHVSVLEVVWGRQETLLLRRFSPPLTACTGLHRRVPVRRTASGGKGGEDRRYQRC